MRTIRKIILHCTGTDVAKQDAAMIRRWHLDRGWRDIGYHWVITQTGELEAGRPEWQVGAHVEGENTDSIGVVVCGDKAFRGVQFVALRGLLIELKKRFPMAQLFGHREFNPHKTCPNFDDAWAKELWESLPGELHGNETWDGGPCRDSNNKDS